MPTFPFPITVTRNRDHGKSVRDGPGSVSPGTAGAPDRTVRTRRPAGRVLPGRRLNELVTVPRRAVKVPRHARACGPPSADRPEADSFTVSLLSQCPARALSECQVAGCSWPVARRGCQTDDGRGGAVDDRIKKAAG